MATIEEIQDPLEHVEYLTRSVLRVQVLEAIHRAPRSREELKEVTDVSRVTLSRTLETFEQRGWIEGSNGCYRVTPSGAILATELARMLANLRAVEELDGAVDWLPIDAFDFELSCLERAGVTTSTWRDHTAAIHRITEVIQAADEIRGAASGLSRGVVGALQEATLQDATSVQMVYDAGVVDLVAGDPGLRQQHLEMLGTGNTEIFLHRGDEPLLMVMTCDATVLLCGHDTGGPPPGALETRAEPARAWAGRYIDEVRGEAKALQARAFMG